MKTNYDSMIEKCATVEAEYVYAMHTVYHIACIASIPSHVGIPVVCVKPSVRTCDRFPYYYWYVMQWLYVLLTYQYQGCFFNTHQHCRQRLTKQLSIPLYFNSSGHAIYERTQMLTFKWRSRVKVASAVKKIPSYNGTDDNQREFCAVCSQQFSPCLNHVLSQLTQRKVAVMNVVYRQLKY